MTKEDDFKSVWGANWSAFLLSFDLNDKQFFPGDALQPVPAPRSRTRSCSLTFAETVELIFLEDDFALCSLLPHRALQDWEEKPWRLEDPGSQPRPHLQPGPESGNGFFQNTPRSFRVTPISRAVTHNPWSTAPSWTQCLWDTVFTAQAEPAGPGEIATISLVSWFLDSDAHPVCSRPRHLCLGPSWWDWDAQVKSLWRDHLDRSRPYVLHLVQPEPPRAADELHQAHVIVSQVLEPQRAALISAVYVNRYGDSQLWRQAYTLPSQLTDHAVFARVPQAWRFRAGDAAHCTIFHDTVVLSDIPRPIPHGAGLVLHHEQPRVQDDSDPFVTVIVHPEEARPEDDEVHFMSYTSGPLVDWAGNDDHSLMATGPPRFIGYAEADDLTTDPTIAQDLAADEDPPLPPDDPPEEDPESDSHGSDDHSLWFSSVTYSLSRPACSGRTDWTDHDTLHRTVAANLAVSHHDLQAVYHVTAPVDLEEHDTQVFVALLHWDQLPGEHFRLVLLDVAFYPRQILRQPEVVREARLLPVQLTRSQLLQLLGLAPYCRLTNPQGCLVWINGQLQLTQYAGHLSISNGDYVKIAVPPTTDLDSDIPTRSAAAACYRGNSINDVVIWHHTTGLDSADAHLVPLLHPGDTDDWALMQTAPAAPQSSYEFSPDKEWRNALYPKWQEALDSPLPWSQTMPKVAVFYLDHQHVLRMDDFRTVELPRDFTQWETLILQAWQDRIGAAPAQIDLVYPDPLTKCPSLAAFLIITQSISKPGSHQSLRDDVHL